MIISDACIVTSAAFFFFSSRRRHTRYWRDWSSDVCSSDLLGSSRIATGHGQLHPIRPRRDHRPATLRFHDKQSGHLRSEERRVGKSVDLGGRRIIKKKNNMTTPTELNR